MTKPFLPVVIALALITALSCARRTGNENRGTNRTPKNAAIAVGNGSGVDPDVDRACINLNTATADTLMLLPGIGPGFARKIIDYRNTHGPFERPQDLIIIDGFGERRYHRIERYVCAY